MKRNQVEAAFDELEASNQLKQAKVWLKASDNDGATVGIIVDAGGYDLFMEDELLVTRYDYDNAHQVKLFDEPLMRYIGANFIPFDSILLIELMTEEVG